MNRMKMFIASGAMAMSLLVCGISSQAAPGASTVSVNADKPSTQSGTTGSKVSSKATESRPGSGATVCQTERVHLPFQQKLLMA